MNQDYIKSVYAGVLGKIIGVYMGRPFEGWRKSRLEGKWGLVDHYVNKDMNKPLVVADDDITGTFTFIRALEDSGLYADTPADFFGETWLNYLVENKTILWWGGIGMSTEHTAYLRLKNGIKAPQSGSMELNGQEVSEQIGAQIFIDAFGLACPGNPEPAAKLAERAARVSHDGEAVNAAKVVAAMISAAFTEKNIERLLDIGLSVIPADSLIARLHHDIREWSKVDPSWRETFDRIHEKYGYKNYGGGCHIIPNHAIMVMAWCWAPDNFRQSQAIINTAGWDTDCNAANVGCLMGVKLGLERINEDYDFQSPFADRVYLPTAEGTRGVSDALREAMHISRIGCRIMNWEIPQEPKNGALFHFSQPGSLHGFMPEKDSDITSCNVVCRNAAFPYHQDERGLEVSTGNLCGPCRVSTPILAESEERSAYDIMGAPIMSPGMTVMLEGCVAEVTEPVDIRSFIRLSDSEAELVYSAISSVQKGDPIVLELKIPISGSQVKDFGIEICGKENSSAKILIDSVRLSGQPEFKLTASDILKEQTFPGWIKDFDHYRKPFPSDPQKTLYLVKSEGTGIFVTGTNLWTDYKFGGVFKIRIGEKAGIVARHQGKKRYIALIRKGSRVQLVKEYYGSTVLMEKDVNWQLHEVRSATLKCERSLITAYLDGEMLGQVDVPELPCGGAGFIFENGCIGIIDVEVTGK